MRRSPKEEAPPPRLEDLQCAAHASARHTAATAKRGSKPDAELQDGAAKRGSQSSREAPRQQVVAQDASVADGRRRSAQGRTGTAQLQSRSRSSTGADGDEVREDPHKLPFPDKQRIFEEAADADSPAKGSAGAASSPKRESAAKAKEEVTPASRKSSQESKTPADGEDSDSGADSDEADAKASPAKDQKSSPGSEGPKRSVGFAAGAGSASPKASGAGAASPKVSSGSASPSSPAKAAGTTPQPRRLTESSAATSSPQTEDESDSGEESDEADGKGGAKEATATKEAATKEAAAKAAAAKAEAKKRESAASSKPTEDSDDEGESSDED